MSTFLLTSWCCWTNHSISSPFSVFQTGPKTLPPRIRERNEWAMINKRLGNYCINIGSGWAFPAPREERRKELGDPHPRLWLLGPLPLEGGSGMLTTVFGGKGLLVTLLGHQAALVLGKKQVILNSHSFSGWGSFKFHLQVVALNRAWSVQAKSYLSVWRQGSLDHLTGRQSNPAGFSSRRSLSAFLPVISDDMPQHRPPPSADAHFLSNLSNSGAKWVQTA